MDRWTKFITTKKVLTPLLISVVLLLTLAGLLFQPILATSGDSGAPFLNEYIAVGEYAAVEAKSQVAGVSTKGKLSVKIKTLDWRGYVLDNYFHSKGSPLQGYGQTFIDACNKYGSSGCIAIPAIAGAESDYCKQPVALKDRNCWGFGGAPTWSTRYRFGSFEEAIDLVTDRLTNQYSPIFLKNPRVGAVGYCGTGSECRSWATNVVSIMTEIDLYSKAIGYGSLKN